MSKYGPETSEVFSDLLELDAPTATVKAPPRAAPVVQEQPRELSPLDKGRALIDDCADMAAMEALAGRFNDATMAAGAWFKALPESTSKAIRLHWRERRHTLVAKALVVEGFWAKLWDFFLAPSVAGALAMNAARITATQRQAIPRVARELPAAESAGTLVEALTNAAHEGADNAGVQGIGSMAGGQLRGVGFSTADGYVTALANGVKAATAEQYKSVLRTTYKLTEAQISRLTVTIIPEGDLPVGKGTTVAPQGKNAAQMTAAERKALWSKTPAQVAEEAKAEAEAKAEELKRKEIMIAGLVNASQGLVLSPGEAQHGVACPAAKLREALAGDERFADLAPRIKSSKAQFGEVMGMLNGNGMRAWANKHSEAERKGIAWPKNVAARWSVGWLNPSLEIGEGTLGTKELIADLVRVAKDGETVYEVQFTGGSAVLRERVQQLFAARVAEETLNSTDLLNWFRGTLLKKFFAQRWGGFIYVPGTKEQTQPVRDLYARVEELLGRDIGIGDVTTGEGWAQGIAKNMKSDLVKIQKVFEQNTKYAQDAARKKAAKEGLGEAAQDAAAAKATASPTAAASRLAELNEYVATINGYKPMLGDEHATLMAQVTAMRNELEPLCDATSALAANIELD